MGDSAVGIDHPFLGPLELLAGPGPDGTMPTAVFCENETNDQRLFGAAPLTPYPKDGINDHVVSGAATVNPERTGTKCSFWYQLTVQPGQTAELRLRLRTAARQGAPRDRRTTRSAPSTARSSRSGRPRRTSSTPSSPRPARAPTRRW